MAVYSMKGPGGAILETTASSIESAWSHLRWRLHTEFGLRLVEARDYDHRDLHEVKH